MYNATKMSDQHKDRKFILLAGMLAAGLVAAVFAGTQMLNATAQAQNNTRAESQPAITSMDDVDCSKDPSLVHCVDGDSSVTSTSALPYNQSGSTVSTSGTATAKVTPDKFTVTVGVETNGTTAEEAASKNANLTADVIAALEELGIAQDQISTSYYNLYPVYAEKIPQCAEEIFPPPPECEPKQILTGYVASNSLGVTLDADGDVDAGEVIDTAVEAGANTVDGVYFSVSQEKQDEVRDSLIEDAIANARHRADVAAGAVGMQVSGIQSISLNDVFFPILSRGVELQSADIGTQILLGEQEVTMNVSIVQFMSGNGTVSTEDSDTTATDNAVAIAREFILSKLPSLGIQIDNELDLHTDMVVAITESDYRVEFGVMDTNGQSHDGHIEITNGEVTIAVLDGESIL